MLTAAAELIAICGPVSTVHDKKLMAAVAVYKADIVRRDPEYL
jgi:hypothetical protein